MDTEIAVDLVRMEVTAGVGQWLPSIDGADEPLFQRSVDWAGTFDQLGLAVSACLPVSTHPGRIG